jgi:hypothetical protein
MVPQLARVISAALNRLEGRLPTGRHPATQDLASSTLLRITLAASLFQQYTVRLHIITVVTVVAAQNLSICNPLALNAVTGGASTASWPRVRRRLGVRRFGVKMRQGTYNAIY